MPGATTLPVEQVTANIKRMIDFYNSQLGAPQLNYDPNKLAGTEVCSLT